VTEFEAVVLSVDGWSIVGLTWDLMSEKAAEVIDVREEMALAVEFCVVFL